MRFEETTSLLVAAGPESTSRLRSTTQPRRGEEKALVGAFSVITNLRMELFQALVLPHWSRDLLTNMLPPLLPASADHGHCTSVEMWTLCQETRVCVEFRCVRFCK